MILHSKSSQFGNQTVNMEKIQSFFLAFALVIVVSQQAQGEGIIDSIKDQVVNLIDKTTDEVKEGVSNLNSLVENTFNSAKDVAANSTQHIANEYQNVVDKVSDMYETNSILSKECSQALDAFRFAYGEMVKKTNNCVDRRIQVGVTHLETINGIADEVIFELQKIRDGAVKCVSNIHGPTNFIKALACINSAAMQATWYVSKKVPSLTVEMTKLGANILLLPPQIGYCFSTQFISTVYGNYQETLSRLNRCIMPSSSAYTTGLPQTTL